MMLSLPEADISFVAGFLADANALFEEVRDTSAWQDQILRMYGKEIPLPRRTAWYGDPETAYTYSGIRNTPLPWTKAITKIRQAVQDHCGLTFNSVLLNQYRTGKDSVAWHADDEPELGTNPVIASISLGATRRFNFKHKRSPYRGTSIDLTHGSLLVMKGPTQANWLHQIPKTTKPVGARINLTFRAVRP